MPILKSLAFTAVPARAHDPVAARRDKLVERLEKQKALLADPRGYVRVVQRGSGGLPGPGRADRLRARQHLVKLAIGPPAFPAPHDPQEAQARPPARAAVNRHPTWALTQFS
jgi:hypothetical protein